MSMCYREEWDCPVEGLKNRIVQLEKEADWLASQCVSLYGNICSEVSASDYDNDSEMNVDYWLEEARRAVEDACS